MVTMKKYIPGFQKVTSARLFGISLAAVLIMGSIAVCRTTAAPFLWKPCGPAGGGCATGTAVPYGNSVPYFGEPGGSWYWMHSADEEKRFIIGLYNRYCIRCHGVDGRGIWDIPRVPDFTNVHWQVSRSDRQITRYILAGRGACMPPFRGTITNEAAWAMAGYLRTFVPGTEVSPPDFGEPEKPAAAPKPPAEKKPEAPAK